MLLILFSSIAVNLNNNPQACNLPPNPLQYLTNNLTKPASKLSLKPTTTYEINKIIQSIKLKDCYGYDEVSSRILKISVPFILSGNVPA